MEIAINVCHGGFAVSEAIFEDLEIEWDGYGFLDNGSFGITSSNRHEYRAHPDLIQALKKLGEDANGEYSKISIVDVPDDINWGIDDYDGAESVHEAHAVWS